MALQRPAKRRKTSTATPSTSFAGDDDDDELNYEPEEVQLRRDPGFHRAVAVHRLKSTFEHIFAKYEKDFSEVGDEIDLRTGRILVDNGHLTGMAHEKDTGEETDAPGSGSDEDEDRILRGGGLSKTLVPRDPRALGKSLGSHAHEGRLSSIGASFLRPSRFSFGTWGARDGPLEAAWQAPALDLPDSNDITSALVQQKYDLPVRKGFESIWNPGPDTAADEEEPPPPQLPGPIIKRPVLPAIRAGTVFKTRVVPDGAAFNEEDDILLGPSATQCLAHAPRKSFHRDSGKIDEPTVEAQENGVESRKTGKKVSSVGVQKRRGRSAKSAKSHSSPINPSKPAAAAAAKHRRHSSGTAARLSDRPLTPTEPNLTEIVLARRPALQDNATWTENHNAALRHSSRRRQKTNFGSGVVAWKDVDSYYHIKEPDLVPSRFYIGIPTSDAFSRDDEAEYVALSDDSDPEPEPIVEVDHRLPTPPIQDDFDVMDVAVRRLEQSKQLADRTIPDSQETMLVSSGMSAAAASPPRKETGSTALVETFRRNEIDPSYAFSDDEDSIFIQKPKAPVRAVGQYETLPVTGRVIEEVSSSSLAPEKESADVAEFLSEVVDSDSEVLVRATRRQRSSRRQSRPSEAASSSGAEESKAQEQIRRDNPQTRTNSLRRRQSRASSRDTQAQPQTEPEDYATIYEDFEHHHSPGKKTPLSNKLPAVAPAQPSSKKSVRFSDLVEEQSSNSRAMVLFSPRKTRSALAARPKQPAPPSPETSLVVAGARAARLLAENAVMRHAPRPVLALLPAPPPPPATPSPAKRTPEPRHVIADSRDSSARSSRSIMSLLPENAADDSDEDELTGRLDYTPRGGARLVRNMFALRVASSGAKPRPSSGGEGPARAGIKRRRSSGDGGGGGGGGGYGMKADRQSSPSESVVRTPGGTLRRCGVDGFVCERDFCFTCI